MSVNCQVDRLDFIILRDLPRPLQKQILRDREISLSQQEATWSLKSLGGGNHSASVVFRLLCENIGADTLGETISQSGVSTIIMRADPEETVHKQGESEAQRTERLQKIFEAAEKEGRAMTTDTQSLQKIITGAICDGSPTFGPPKYHEYRNRKIRWALSVLLDESSDAKDGMIMAERLFAVSAVALNQIDMVPATKLAKWLRFEAYAGNLNVLNFFEDEDSHAKKLEILEFHATHQNDIFPQGFHISKSAQRDAGKQYLIGVFGRIENKNNDAISDPGLITSSHQVTAIEHVEENVVERRPSILVLASLTTQIDLFQRKLNTLSREDLECRDIEGRTPLLMACMFGNIVAARLLLSQGASAGSVSNIGQGVFHYLASIIPSEHTRFAAELLRAGASVNAMITSGLNIRKIISSDYIKISFASGTPLHHAIMYNDLSAVETLLFSGADALLKNEEHLSPIELAASLHCPEILEALINATKLDVASWKDHFGNSLVYAALDGQWNMFRRSLHLNNHYPRAQQTLTLLQEKGADWNDLCFAFEVPALHFACRYSSVNIVSLLLDLGYSYQINTIGVSLTLSLFTAITRGDEHMFLLLLDHGADAKVRHPTTGDSCLHVCIDADFTDTFFIDVLLQHGADIDATNKAGRTPFFEAVASKQFHAATFLLSRGADKEHKDSRVSKWRYKAM